VPIRELRQQYEPAVIRYFLLMVHYRTPLEFSYERLDEAKAALERIRTAYQRGQAYLREHGDTDADSLVAEPYLQQFRAAMNHDFNTAQALAAVFEVVRELNTRLNAPELSAQSNTAAIQGLLDALRWMMETVLGVSLSVPAAAQSELVEQLMHHIIAWRQELRSRKLYDLADRIRDELRAMGILLEDTPQGTTWRRGERVQ